MQCEIDGKDGTTLIGRIYPQGNLKGECGTPIRIKFNPPVLYFNLLPNGEHVPMEYDPRTGESKKINIPLL